MPTLVRKLLIIAAAEGLLLHPQHPRGQKAVALEYSGSTNLIPWQKEVPKDSASLEAHGIVGLFTVARSSFLIGITGRKQVAQIRGKPIYMITGVALIPLSSQGAAQQAIEAAQRKENRPDGEDSSDSEEELEQHQRQQEIASVGDPQTPAADLEATTSNDSSGQDGPRADSSVAEDVISKKGKYGRFADNWFTRAGWRKDARRVQDISEGEESMKRKQAGQETMKGDALESNQADTDAVAVKQVGKMDSDASSDPSAPLLPKLLRTTRLLFTSRSFFYSYDIDVSHRLGTQEPENDVALHKKVEPSFFWNRHLLGPFTDQSRGHPFALPIFQGFVGQKAFSINTHSNSIANVKENAGEVFEMQDNAASSTEFKANPNTKDFLITLISRRSTQRPGLRYLRRGVDDGGNVANYVETEQILSDPTWTPTSTVYSFTQIRGSIPLYFSQSPYSLKPVPMIHHSTEKNAAALKRHFAKVLDQYGGVQVACLIDKHGTEAKVGVEFEDQMKNYNEQNDSQKVHFYWFDFHNVCRGMKFENVSLLFNEIGPTLKEFGITTERDGKIVSRQKGVLRVNCMDCLDRTNVVESAAAQRALEQQLSAEGVELDMQADPSTSWFNTLWADNGDAISKQYSSTAALKGDFTRTRKRNYRGALNDFGLTLSRYYNNIVNDYFSQTTIDFMLGNVGDDVFDEFEQNMMTSDPAEQLSMRRIRQAAIDNSSKIVIADEKEDLVAGWTVLSPRQPNTVRTSSTGMEEVVLLLTDTALYAVRFDWTTEKVASFERIDLKNIKSLTRGTYISSVLTASQCDPKRNVGFVIKYLPGPGDEKRVNTRSLSTSANADEIEAAAVPATNPQFSGVIGERQQRAAGQIAANAGELDLNPDQPPPQIEEETPKDMNLLAFKALPSRLPSEARETRTATPIIGEENTVKSMVDDIARVAGKEAIEADVVSLDEAKRSTGLLDTLSYKMKRMVWG